MSAGACKDLLPVSARPAFNRDGRVIRRSADGYGHPNRASAGYCGARRTTPSFNPSKPKMRFIV